MPIASDPTAVPLVGRDAPLNLLKMAAEAAFKDGAGAAVLSGEAGLGKSRLISSLTEAFGAKVRCARVSCLNRIPAPLSTFRDLLSVAADFLGRPPPEVAPDLARFIPDLGVEPSAEIEPAFERRRLFKAVETWLQKAAKNRQIMLAIDNLHWADQTSANLFRYLATNLKAPVVLVAATRQADMRSFWHPRIHRLALGPLSEEDGRDLATALLGKGALSDHAFAAIWHKCQGNPGAFLEALRSLEDSGLLRRGLGGWIAPYQLPPRPWDEALLSRIEKLDPISRDLLQMLAVVERADTDVLVRLSLMDPDQVTQKVDALIWRGLVAQRGGQVQFDPPYAREVVYESIPAAVRQELHLAAGELLEGDPAAESFDLAYHFSRSQPRKAVAYLVSLGEEALAYGATEEAGAFLGQAIGYMEAVNDPEDSGLLMACREAYGAILADRDPDRAAAMLEVVVRDLQEMVDSRIMQSRTRALKKLVSYLPAPISDRIKISLYSPKHLIPRNATPRDRLQSAMRSLAVAEGTRGNYERAQELLDSVAEISGKDPAANLDLAVIASRFQVEAGFFPRASKIAQDALESMLRNRTKRSLSAQIIEVELRFIMDLVAALRGEASHHLEDAPELLSEIGPSLGFTPELPRLIRLARQGRWRAMEDLALRVGEAWAGRSVARWATHARAWTLFEARVPRAHEEALSEAAAATDPVSISTVALVHAIEQAEGGDIEPLEECVLAMRKSKSFLLTQALVSLGEVLLPQSGPTTLNRVKGIAIESHLRATEAKFR
ncbi:MAG: AAA family ATPase, partial [Candidatus Sericytochromatia bacterium]|nr:AAA family ATPase [Candidatus Tanganyikabacteria bacterium]